MFFPQVRTQLQLGMMGIKEEEAKMMCGVKVLKWEGEGGVRSEDMREGTEKVIE